MFYPTLYSSVTHWPPLNEQVVVNAQCNLSESSLSSTIPPDPRLLLTTPLSTPIIVDLGATFGISPFESDLIPGTAVEVNSSVKNFSGSSKITHKGFGWWNVVDTEGHRATIEPFLYIFPKAEVQLFSPRDYFRCLKGGS